MHSQPMGTGGTAAVPRATITTSPAGPRPANRAAARRRAVRTARKRRDAAALAHRAVAAAFVFEDIVAPPPPEQRLFVRRDVLDPTDVQAMLASCSSTSRTGLRDRGLIAAGYWACVRPAEAPRLELDDFDAAAGTLTVRGRNGTRAVHLPGEAVEALASWVEKRRRLHKPRAHVGMFCTLTEGMKPGRITAKEMEGALQRVARSARINKPVGFDALRAARAKELALAGIELPALTDLLDHMHLKTGGGKGELRQDLAETRRLVTAVAPQAPCLAFYRKPISPICRPGYRKGQPPPNKDKTYPAEVLTSEEIRSMLRQLPKSGPFRLRNRALIVVMWRCGLRVAEALALEVRDLELKAGTVTVRHGKGDKRRIVGMDPQAARDLERWLEARERLGLGCTGFVFCTLQLPYRGGPMHSPSTGEMLKDLARKAGIQKRVHAHGLRHTHAFELACERVPLPIIQKQLGHNDLLTTAHYLNHFADVHVIAAMQAREWDFKR